jgi:transcriptional regulator with XRE-family HTH domain
VHTDAPPGTEQMAELTRRLRTHLDETGTSLSEFARASGLSRTTVHGVASGTTWIDVITLARLEAATDQPLWQLRR